VRHGEVRTAYCDDAEAANDAPSLKLVVHTAV